MLKSEQILHSKKRQQKVYLPEAYGVLPFVLKEIDETEMDTDFWKMKPPSNKAIESDA